MSGHRSYRSKLLHQSRGKKIANNSVIESDQFHLCLPSAEGTSYVLASPQHQVVSPGASATLTYHFLTFGGIYKGQPCRQMLHAHMQMVKVWDGSSLIQINCSAPKRCQKYTTAIDAVACASSIQPPVKQQFQKVEQCIFLCEILMIMTLCLHIYVALSVNWGPR